MGALLVDVSGGKRGTTAFIHRVGGFMNPFVVAAVQLQAVAESPPPPPAHTPPEAKTQIVHLKSIPMPGMQ